MKLSFLLAQRQALLQQARLAHLAHAYDRLDDFTRRVARARLRPTPARSGSSSRPAPTSWPTRGTGSDPGATSSR
mgnify:CR=1 FL=1